MKPHGNYKVNRRDFLGASAAAGFAAAGATGFAPSAYARLGGGRRETATPGEAGFRRLAEAGGNRAPRAVLPATTLDLLAALVGYDTTSAKSNLAFIAFVQDYLTHHGIESTLIPSPDGNKACLFATIGPEGIGGIGLSAHSDCVPVEDQPWSSDPFKLREAGGKVFGRGTADMKGFIACVLASVPLFKARALKEPIHILISYDEEVGCFGARELVAHLGRDLPRPRAIIVGEPTLMKVIDSHKGFDSYLTIVTGREAHSSLPALGVNAISVAASLIGEIDRLGAAVAAKYDNPRFDPPYTTVSVGTIEGGTAANIVPKRCEFRWLVRALPGHPHDEIERGLAAYAETLLPKMLEVAEEASIETISEASVAALKPNPDSEAVKLALDLTGAKDVHTVSYATEAGVFDEAGLPTVVCGPGSIAQGHKADEFIALSELDAGMAFLEKLADRLSA